MVRWFGCTLPTAQQAYEFKFELARVQGLAGACVDAAPPSLPPAVRKRTHVRQSDVPYNVEINKTRNRNKNRV